MPSQAVKDAKLGFFVAAGFLVFGISLSIILGLSMWAVGKTH
jgi:hypothetical protein